VNLGELKDIGIQLAKIGLPILGTAIGGPAGLAVRALIAGKLGLSADANPAQIATAISDPANLVKLQELQNQHEEFLVNAASVAYQAMLKAQTDDLASARNLAQIDISHGNALTSALSALVRPIWGLGSFVVVAYSYWQHVPLDGSIKDIVSIVLQFYFGGKIVEAVTPHLAEALATFGRK